MKGIGFFGFAGVAAVFACLPGAVPHAKATNVTKLYEDTCAKCHGSRAEGGGAGTRSLISKDKFDQKWDKPFFNTIKNGDTNSGMEPYGNTLSDEEVWALVVHIRELQLKGLRESTPSPKPENGIVRTKLHNYRISDVVTTGLNTPWAIDWLADQTLLVTNRSGYMTAYRGSRAVKVKGLPASREIGQGGLMQVKVHPNGWVYLSFTDPSTTDAHAGMTKLVRGHLVFNGSVYQWTDQQTIFAANPSVYNGSGIHFGAKIVFDNKGHVFFGIGERGSSEFAQNVTRPNGKIYRVMEDGSIPADNPFVKTEGAIGQIWSIGHRNPQGLTIDNEGNLWDTEHGPRGGDELNFIQKGNNYGWPDVGYGINYNDSPFHTPFPTSQQKVTMPVLRWVPSIAASGLTTVKGNAFTHWRGDLLAGGLAGNTIQRIRVKAGKLVDTEEILFGIGRIRDVAMGPDGMVYVVVNQPDKVIQLSPIR